MLLGVCNSLGHSGGTKVVGSGPVSRQSACESVLEDDARSTDLPYRVAIETAVHITRPVQFVPLLKYCSCLKRRRFWGIILHHCCKLLKHLRRRPSYRNIYIHVQPVWIHKGPSCQKRAKYWTMMNSQGVRCCSNPWICLFCLPPGTNGASEQCVKWTEDPLSLELWG